MARLIRQLGSDSFAGRQQAEDELARLGVATREQLEQAIESNDAEVRLRAELLRKLQLDQLWQASTVTLPAATMPVSKALAELTRQSGNQILFGDRFEPLNDVAVDARSGQRRADGRLLARARFDLPSERQSLSPPLRSESAGTRRRRR